MLQHAAELNALTDVPSLAARATAPAQVRPLVDTFPVPNGADLGSGFAEFAASYTDPSRFDAASLRLDFAAPAGAYSARLTVRDFEERRGVRVHAKTRIPVESGRVHLRWLLTRAETRRLRAGRYRVTVTIRNRRGTDGETVSGTLVVRSERR